MRRHFIIALLIVAFIGIFDAGFLTKEHYSNSIPPCSTSIWVDCGRVLKSQYAMIGPLPLAVLGLAYYSTMFGLGVVRLMIEKQPTVKDMLWKMVEKYARPHSWTLEKMLFVFQMLIASSAFLFSLYFVYLQLVVIGAICLYCMGSALLSTVLFLITFIEYWRFFKGRWLEN